MIPGFRYRGGNLVVENGVGPEGTKANWVNPWQNCIFNKEHNITGRNIASKSILQSEILYLGQNYRHKYGTISL